ncbi:MAG: hypothetical protein Q7S56_00620 [Nanoarchaeota archaeon]|nr:hypothetical protein [Nanoarchaeota archaeon]
MARNLSDKANDCPLPIVELLTLIEAGKGMSSRPNEDNYQTYLNKMKKENLILYEILREITQSRSDMISGVTVYFLLRAQAIKDQTKEYD